MNTVAALFISDYGPYWKREGVDAWDITRDAKGYDGDLPVVAHPPCDRWGRYWSGGPSVKVKKIKGDDNGCFKSALASVNRCGGVLEHPEASHAFAHFQLTRPLRFGGWSWSSPGWVCCVEQGHYGHPSRKATWLYYVGEKKPPELIWGKSEGARMEDGFHSTAERVTARAAGIAPVKRISAKERVATPEPFAELLLGIARNK